MWSRRDLKDRGRQAFFGNYWMTVLAALIITIVTVGFIGGNRSAANSSQYYSSGGSFFDAGGFWFPFGVILGVAVGLIALLLWVLKILVGNVFLVGAYRFFVLNQTEKPSAGTFLYGFQTGNYINIFLTMFLRDLYTFLWMLLFVIPGIIKHYEYLMVPYILAENPAMRREDAFMISRKMMMGQKMDVFVLDLSFIGWRILEGITGGIFGIFFVEPYYQATAAELYTANKAMAYQEGFIR